MSGCPCSYSGDDAKVGGDPSPIARQGKCHCAFDCVTKVNPGHEMDGVGAMGKGPASKGGTTTPTKKGKWISRLAKKTPAKDAAKMKEAAHKKGAVPGPTPGTRAGRPFRQIPSGERPGGPARLPDGRSMTRVPYYRAAAPVDRRTFAAVRKGRVRGEIGLDNPFESHGGGGQGGDASSQDAPPQQGGGGAAPPTDIRAWMASRKGKQVRPMVRSFDQMPGGFEWYDGPLPAGCCMDVDAPSNIWNGSQWPEGEPPIGSELVGIPGTGFDSWYHVWNTDPEDGTGRWVKPVGPVPGPVQVPPSQAPPTPSDLTQPEGGGGGQDQGQGPVQYDQYGQAIPSPPAGAGPAPAGGGGGGGGGGAGPTPAQISPAPGEESFYDQGAPGEEGWDYQYDQELDYNLYGYGIEGETPIGDAVGIFDPGRVEYWLDKASLHAVWRRDTKEGPIELKVDVPWKPIAEWIEKHKKPMVVGAWPTMLVIAQDKAIKDLAAKAIERGLQEAGISKGLVFDKIMEIVKKVKGGDEEAIQILKDVAAGVAGGDASAIRAADAMRVAEHKLKTNELVQNARFSVDPKELSIIADELWDRGFPETCQAVLTKLAGVKARLAENK